MERDDRMDPYSYEWNAPGYSFEVLDKIVVDTGGHLITTRYLPGELSVYGGTAIDGITGKETKHISIRTHPQLVRRPHESTSHVPVTETPQILQFPKSEPSSRDEVTLFDVAALE